MVSWNENAEGKEFSKYINIMKKEEKLFKKQKNIILKSLMYCWMCCVLCEDMDVNAGIEIFIFSSSFFF